MDERALRIPAAVALLIGGLVHLQLYFLGYRSYPDANLGRSFILNAVVSAIIASALVVQRGRAVRIAGMLVAAGTLIAFTLTRSTDVVFGFRERGLEPSPQAIVALVSEVVALLLLALTFIPRLPAARQRSGSSTGPTAVAVAMGALVLLGFGSLWAQSYAHPDPRDANSVETTARGSDPPPGAAPTAAAPDIAPSTSADVATASTATAPPQPAEGTSPDASTSAPTADPTSTAPGTTVAAVADGITVDIIEFAFSESAASVPVGSTIAWTNSDQFDHSVVARDRSFESGSLGAGDTFAHVFETPGEYAYICGIHPYMEGTVSVTG